MTHRLTRGAIEYEELEPLELKGKAEPVPAWEAVRLPCPRPRPPRAASGDPAGRPRGRVRAAGVAVRPGGQRGPPAPGDRDRPGRGRQVAAAARADAAASATASRRRPSALGSCPAYGAGLAYWALGEIVRGQFEIVDTDDSERGLAQAPPRDRGAGRRRRGADEPPERLAAALGRPLGIEPPASTRRRTADAEDPQQMRERLFSAVRTLIEAASRAPAAGLRDRGHPLGGRGDARPDRVPRALGPRARP